LAASSCYLIPSFLINGLATLSSSDLTLFFGSSSAVEKESWVLFNISSTFYIFDLGFFASFAPSYFAMVMVLSTAFLAPASNDFNQRIFNRHLLSFCFYFVWEWGSRPLCVDVLADHPFEGIEFAEHACLLDGFADLSNDGFDLSLVVEGSGDVFIGVDVPEWNALLVEDFQILLHIGWDQQVELGPDHRYERLGSFHFQIVRR
jgi:hypothetical protein